MNTFRGSILAIEAQESIALIDVALGSHRLCATVLGSAAAQANWRLGQNVQLMFNEMEVALAKNFQGQISLRNRLPGKITQLEFGKILTRVEFLLAPVEECAEPCVELCSDILIQAVITTRSARALELAVGDTVLGLVKSNEVNLMAVEGV